MLNKEEVFGCEIFFLKILFLSMQKKIFKSMPQRFVLNRTRNMIFLLLNELSAGI